MQRCARDRGRILSRGGQRPGRGRPAGRLQTGGVDFMNKRIWIAVALPAAFCAGVATAQYPILDAVAQRVIQKYQTSTCEQLWENKGKHGPEEQRVIGFLRQDPAMRQAFFNQIAGPVVNKMFECGMIP
jgi:hypothetical protein